MSSSSYYDAIKRVYYTCGSTELLNEIKLIRQESSDFGYRTVTDALRNRGIIVNHKVVLKLMQENDLLCHAFEKTTKKYNFTKDLLAKPLKIN